MALGTMTKTAGQSGASSPGPLFVDTISFLADASYPTGGSAFEAAYKALVGAGREVVQVIPGDCGGYVPVFIPADGKLKVYYGDFNNAGDGPLIEVPNATNLGAVTFNLTVLSR
ncbi:MAG: hypothetical protein AB7V19_07075 [Candidatus Bipolaricaulia bacterium]